MREVVVFANMVEMSCEQGILRKTYRGFSLNKLTRPTLLDREIKIVNECHHVGWQAVFSVLRSRAAVFTTTRYERLGQLKGFNNNTHECNYWIVCGMVEKAVALNCQTGVLSGSCDTTTRGKLPRNSTHVPISSKHSSGRQIHGPELSTRSRDSHGLCVGVHHTGNSRAEDVVRTSVLVLDSEHNVGILKPTLVNSMLFYEASKPNGMELTSANTMGGVSAHLGDTLQSSVGGAVLDYNSTSVLMVGHNPNSDQSAYVWDCMGSFNSASTRIICEADDTNQINPQKDALMHTYAASGSRAIDIFLTGGDYETLLCCSFLGHNYLIAQEYVLKRNALDRKKFDIFLTGGDYVKTLLCCSFLGHNYLIAQEYALEKNAPDGRKLDIFLTGGDYVETLLCCSFLGHNYLIAQEHMLKKSLPRNSP